MAPQRQQCPFIAEVTFNFLSITGLLQLETGLSASVLKPQVKRHKPKVSTIKHAIKPPVSRVVKLMEKYKVKQKETC